jgi:hypothetical protein
MERNEAIVSAAAAVQAVATLVLVGVTVWYVRLTRGILRTSQAQLADAHSLLDAGLQLSRNHLRGQLEKFKAAIDPLPPTGIPVPQLRLSAMWSAPDEEKLLHLASGMGSVAAEAASRAVPSLMWLRELHARIVRTSELQGYGLNDREARLYQQHRTAALRELRTLEEVTS